MARWTESIHGAEPSTCMACGEPISAVVGPTGVRWLPIP